MIVSNKQGVTLMKHLPALLGAALAIFAFHGLATDSVKAQTPPTSWKQVGMLTCKLNPSIGFVIFGL